MFEVRDILLFGVLAGRLAAVALALWPYSRQRRRFVVAGITTTTIGFVSCNLVLNATNATGFNVDVIVFVSRADAGSGVVALPLPRWSWDWSPSGTRRPPAWLARAALTGLSALLLDRFIL